MKKKMNNKGFSLVELIIVIAIMVILVAVLAPQYLKYVEKSRVSTDVQTTVELINVMQVLAADPDVSLIADSKTSSADAKYSAICGANADTVTISTELAKALTDNGMMDAAAIANIKYQSASYKTPALAVYLYYDADKQVWTIKTEGLDSSGKIATPAGS